MVSRPQGETRWDQSATNGVLALAILPSADGDTFLVKKAGLRLDGQSCHLRKMVFAKHRQEVHHRGSAIFVHSHGNRSNSKPMEPSGPDVDAGTPEEEVTPIKLHIPAECVPETSPTRMTAPVQSGLGDQVARFARDLGLGSRVRHTGSSVPAARPSSADAARSIPEKEKRGEERFNRSNTESTRVRAT